MPPKRKRSSAIAPEASTDGPAPDPHDNLVPPPANISTTKAPTPKRRTSRRFKIDTNPDRNTEIIDGKTALRASPDSVENEEVFEVDKRDCGTPKPAKRNDTRGTFPAEDSDSPLSDIPTEIPVSAPARKRKKPPSSSSNAAKGGANETQAPKRESPANKAAVSKAIEADGDESVERQDPDGDEAVPSEDLDTMKKEAGRPPPVNSDYLPIPWKGRLGYACLNTYLRHSNPPVFSSRTCRIASILEHRHPLKDPTQPEHPSKNRPDKTQPASIERGQRWVEELGLANARDIVKMLRWNDKYGIKFMRLSSEMFPFASHLEYGYRLAPFASEVLAEAGREAARLGHRLSTHPGQFTQLGSPRPEVIANAIRDLEYHDEMLSLLKLPPQPDRDAVIILHMGGTFGDKAATIDRFRSNYKDLSPSIKQRLVLENDDVSWSVHDLLPVCEELNIPFCLDFHHHNIIFDSSQVREGTLDIMSLFPRIKATWDRKGMKQKMHYSEATPEAVTRNQRRKHNARPSTLPPCPNDMDLMIEAKDKEQAIFELMRTYKLPGWDNFNDIIPYERVDENNVQPKKSKKKSKKQIKKEIEEFGRELSEEEEVKEEIKEEDIGMGGKENRVYWPVGMEEWLRPKKREVKKKNGMDEEEMFKNPTPANFAARKAVMARNKEPLNDETKERLRNATNVADIQKILEDIKKERIDQAAQENAKNSKPKKEAKPRKATPVKKKTAKSTQKRGVSNLEDEEDEDLSMPDLSSADDDEIGETTKMTATAAEQPRQSGRVKGKRKSYTETEIDQEED